MARKHWVGAPESSRRTESFIDDSLGERNGRVNAAMEMDVVEQFGEEASTSRGGELAPSMAGRSPQGSVNRYTLRAPNGSGPMLHVVADIASALGSQVAAEYRVSNARSFWSLYCFSSYGSI